MSNEHNREVTPDSFGIASKNWPGLAKLGEEANEVGQEVMKIVATGGGLFYGVGTPLFEETLWDEIGDLLAAIRYAVVKNCMPLGYIEGRAEMKYRKYEDWYEKERAL